MDELPAPRPVTGFCADGLERVVADSLRFRQRLRIGEEAYGILRTKNRLISLWDTAGAAATGAGVASSSVVASSFFAPTGLAATLGLATATTPIGWVIAAAVVAGSGWYGASRWIAGKGEGFVDTIPRYINTPIDVLGAALVDLLGSLALRVSVIDGRIDPAERQLIAAHFVQDWGIDRDYAERALDSLATHADATRVKDLAKNLAAFVSANPDCNGPAMQEELMEFLRELIAADGVLDEREELALEAIERQFVEENRLTMAKMGAKTVDAIGEATSTVSAVAGESAKVASSVVGGAVRSVGSVLSRKIEEGAQFLHRSKKLS